MLTRKMKDSEIKWIGEIPEDWEIRKLKYTLEERNEKNNPIITDNILSLSVERGIFPYAEKTGGGNKSKSDLTAYKVAHPNDIVINSMNILAGAVGLSRYTGVVSPVYYTLYTTSEEINITYYYYLFRTREFQRSLLGLGNGIMMRESSTGKLNTIRMRIPMDKLAGLFLPLPPRRVQDLIVKSLAKDIKVVNKLINQTEQSIKELKNYKQSLITESVTKGIDPNVEMKDSGIEWVRDVPKNWEVKPIKYSVNERKEQLNSQMNPYDEINYVDISSVSYAKGVEKIESLKFKDAPSRARKIVYHNDIIISTVRTYLKSIDRINYNIPLIVSTGFCVLKPRNHISANFLEYAIKSDYFTNQVEQFSTGIAYPSITSRALLSLNFIEPPLNEQQEIFKYLNDKVDTIDRLIEDKTKVVEELENYKNSLIYEYVTGKKEV
ncbi:restriction endonuclease subunit S [Staphylococcus nepalensis]|uniref:restriction endonuclease subunit S n=1 Tax=Staphylococcus nepalensis TaxID=214473 RepID=UPI000BC3436F|nr:restriction endonuclease subunit S [Staphylococcus nepalensis]ATH63911.1 restriction endonuclease subunit S [Staphylococcus nepalensis]